MTADKLQAPRHPCPFKAAKMLEDASHNGLMSSLTALHAIMVGRDRSMTPRALRRTGASEEAIT